MFYICLTWLMTSSVMSMMMSSVTSLMMSSCMTSSVMCPITQHQKQTFHIHILRARPPRSRLLSTLGGLANSPVGGMPPGEVRSGFSRHPSDVILLLNFCRFQKWHHVALACLSTISHLTFLQKPVKLGRTTTSNIVVIWARARKDLQELVPICLGKRDMVLLPDPMCRRMSKRNC